LVLVVFELVYLVSSFIAMPPLFNAAIAFPALFILPGLMLLKVLRKGVCDTLELFVQGFFVSSVLMVMLTAFFFALGISPTQFTYSVAALLLVFLLTPIGLMEKIEIKLRKIDVLFIVLALSAYIVLFLFFYTLPRLFTPDETAYISAARMGTLNRAAPPMGVLPNRNEVTAVLQGRSFWIYLMTSFLGATGLPAYQAGLLGIVFIVMTAFASSLLVTNKWLSLATFFIVIINPLLFSFSALTLNDLALAFYAIFAALFFIKSFESAGNNTSISISNIIFSILGLVVMSLIKENLTIVFAMWIILIFVIFKYRLYKQDRKYRVLLGVTLIPVLIYEFFIDTPYVISVWILRNGELGNIFGRFLPVSPTETVMKIFIAPWWNPNASTIFSYKFINYLDYFYRLLTPESSTIIVSALLISAPLILWKDKRGNFQIYILAWLSLISLCVFYLQSLGSSYFSDIARYSLWMTPLWIALALTLIYEIVKTKSIKKLFAMQLMMLVIIWINLQITKENGGVYVGYGLTSRLWTIDSIVLEVAAITLIFGLLMAGRDFFTLKLFGGKLKPIAKSFDLKKICLMLLILLMAASNIYFVTQFISNNSRYTDQKLAETSNTLDELTNNQSLIFANNYIYMRPYVSDEIFKNGLILPPPETEEEFLNLLKVAPNNTMFLISNNAKTAWYEYANNYIKNFTNADFITPDKPDMTSLSKFNLSDDILHMTFDDANNITVPDSSPSKNNGSNIGAQIVDGYSGKALEFNGTGYVSIPNEGMPSLQNATTIDFMALIKQADPQQGYMIISKGYAPINGSFVIFIWNKEIYFELGAIGYVGFPVQNYLGEWHNFIFTYNGEEMEALVDGISVASRPASGFICPSNYDVEIGRDGERQAYYFNGTIDELQISNSPLNTTALAENSLKHYALKIQTLSGGNWVNTFFKTVNRDNPTTEANVHVNSTRMTINNNRTITLSIAITSDISVNATLLTSTDRFAKVYPIDLTKGPNNVSFEYPYNTSLSSSAGGNYWLYLDQTRVTLIVNNKILYNSFISIQNLPLMNLYLLLLTGILLATYLIISYASSRHRNSLLKRLDAQYLSTST
jgi:hypothetical protein